MDCGSTLLPTFITNEIPTQLTSDMIIDTGVMDIMRLYLNDCIEFISDLEAFLKLKVGLCVSLQGHRTSARRSVMPSAGGHNPNEL